MRRRQRLSGAACYGAAMATIRIVPAAHNPEGRHDGDWIAEDGPCRPGTVADWRAACAEAGRRLVLGAGPSSPHDPFESGLRDWAEVAATLGLAAAERQPSSSEAGFADDAFAALTYGAGFWPRRLSGLRGTVRVLHRAARRRGLDDDVASRAIAAALGAARGADAFDARDRCARCRREFRLGSPPGAVVRAMLQDGYAATCPACAAARPARDRA